MMKLMKYIIIEDRGKQIPILFSNLLKHRDVANRLNQRKEKEGNGIIGAGFVRLQDGQIKCSGESISLDIKSRGEEDASIINDFLII